MDGGDDSSERDGQDEHGNQCSTLVAISYTKNSLSVACYEELSDTISVFTGSVSASDMNDTLTNIKSMFTPTLFLIHPKINANKPLLDLLLTHERTDEADFYRFQVLKSSDWNEKHGLELIYKNMKVRGCAQDVKALNSMIDINDDKIGEPRML
jgi:hypothetical protein